MQALSNMGLEEKVTLKAEIKTDTGICEKLFEIFGEEK